MKPGWTSRRSWRSTSSRAGARAAERASGSSRRSSVARGVEDRDRLAHRRGGPVGEMAGDVRAQPGEARLVPRRPARLRHQVLQRGDRRVLEHRPQARVRRGGERELRGVRQLAGDVLDRRGHVQREQLARAVLHRLALRRGRLEHAHADGRALVDERRVAAHGLAGARQRDGLRQRPDRPLGQPVLLERRGGGRERLAQPRPDLARAARRGRRPPRRARRARPRRGTSCAGAAGAGRGPTPRAGCGRRAAPRARARARRAAARCAASPASSTAAATSGTGTSDRRSSLGSERISAVTSSGRSAGTSQSKPIGLSCGNHFSGTCTVTPSRAAPGSNT